MLRVAVPSLLTTIPAAILASCAAWETDNPNERPSAIHAITVSPAPVISNTSLAFVGKFTMSLLLISVIPFSLLVRINCWIFSLVSSFFPEVWMLDSEVCFFCVASQNSLKFGVIYVAFLYLE